MKKIGAPMFKVLDRLLVGSIYCISVEGDISLLKKGLKLIDEKENIFKIETVAMTEYKNIKDMEHYAELTLSGDVENIGKFLFLHNDLY